MRKLPLKHVASRVFCTSILTIALLLSSASYASQEGIASFLAFSDESYIIKDARIFDGSGVPAKEGRSIWIDKGRIKKIASIDKLSLPDDIKVISAKGKTVIPGLIMMHEHLAYLSSPKSDIFDLHPNTIPTLLLASGITTARTAGSDLPQADISVKDSINAAKQPGPNLIITGPYFNGQRQFSSDLLVSNTEEAKLLVKFLAAKGVEWLKVYSSLPPEVVKVVIEEAHKHDLRVAGHLGPATSCAQAAEYGLDTLEHSIDSCWVKRTPEEMTRLVNVLIKNDVTVVTNAPWRRDSPNDLEAIAMYSPQYLDDFKEPTINKQSSENIISPRNKAAMQFDRQFYDAGGTLLMGADAIVYPQVPGFSNHNMMIALGMRFTPAEVLQMATSDAAEYLGIEKERGLVKVGYIADLVLVDGSPDKEIKDIKNISLVIKDGRAYDPKKLLDSAKGRLGID